MLQHQLSEPPPYAGIPPQSQFLVFWFRLLLMLPAGCYHPCGRPSDRPHAPIEPRLTERRTGSMQKVAKTPSATVTRASKNTTVKGS